VLCAAACLSLSDDGGAIARGRQALERGDLAAAERAFVEAVRREPSNPRALKYLGQVYSAEEKYREAEPLLRKACALDAAEENACYYLGRLLFTAGRLDDAQVAFGRAIGVAAERGRALNGLAETLEAVGDSAAAEKRFREAIAAGAPRVAYGLFLFHQGRLRESLEVLSGAGDEAALARVRMAAGESPRSSKGIEPVPVQFTETSLPVVLNNGTRGEKHLPEAMLGGVAVFDYDNDGWPDIFVTNGAAMSGLEKTGASFQNHLFHNNHDRTFTDVTAKAGLAGIGYSMGAAAGDFDNDGWVDLLVTSVTGIALYRNRGDGTFENVTQRAELPQGKWAVAAGWFDYDNDGWLDLFVVNYVAWDPGKEPFCGERTPAGRTYCHPKNYAPVANLLLHNERNRKFRDVSAASGIGNYPGKGMGVAFGDYDGDGLLDVMVTNDTMPNFLFHNLGNGRFREEAIPAGVAYNEDGAAVSAMGVDFRDYDNDGREDLIVTTLTNEAFSVLRNLGGRFANLSSPSRIATASLPWTGWGVGMYDFNNDGWKDIFVACGHVQDNAELTSSRQSKQPNLLLLNHGNGTFSPTLLSYAAFHRGVAFGDFDRDGRIDIVVSRIHDKPLVLKNSTEGAGHWLELRLIGNRSNRDGIGSRIAVTTDAGSQWNRVTTAVGYSSSSDRIAHFGLGRDRVARRIEIEWPAGETQRCNDVAADRLIVVHEGKDCPANK
jgi:Flp pilus assembly protein TadD